MVYSDEKEQIRKKLFLPLFYTVISLLVSEFHLNRTANVCSLSGITSLKWFGLILQFGKIYMKRGVITLIVGGVISYGHTFLASNNFLTLLP